MDIRARQLETPEIVWLAQNNRVKEFKTYLTNHPEEINLQGPGGLTALHWACSNRNLEIFELLLEHEPEKANPWIEDVRGKKPVDLAIDRHADVLVTKLFQRMYPD